MDSRILDAVVFTGLGLALGLVWWKMYVEPHDRVRTEILECMREMNDMSESAYKQCHEKLRPKSSN